MRKDKFSGDSSVGADVTSRGGLFQLEAAPTHRKRTIADDIELFMSETTTTGVCDTLNVQYMEIYTALLSSQINLTILINKQTKLHSVS